MFGDRLPGQRRRRLPPTAHSPLKASVQSRCVLLRFSCSCCCSIHSSPFCITSALSPSLHGNYAVPRCVLVSPPPFLSFGAVPRAELGAGKSELRLASLLHHTFPSALATRFPPCPRSHRTVFFARAPRCAAREITSACSPRVRKECIRDAPSCVAAATAKSPRFW